MNSGTATLVNYRQSPRKVRLIADMVKGKEAGDAIKILHFTQKRASAPLARLIESALANAKNEGATAKDSFRIARFTVDGGMVLKRSMPRARGRAFPIKKRCSHVTVVLERFEPTVKVKKGKVAVEVSDEKPAKRQTKKASK